MLLCEQNFRDVWSRNESVRAEIGQILHTHAAKLVVEIPTSEIYFYCNVLKCVTCCVINNGNNSLRSRSVTCVEIGCVTLNVSACENDGECVTFVYL